jgi:HlyD family secretion protein
MSEALAPPLENGMSGARKRRRAWLLSAVAAAAAAALTASSFLHRTAPVEYLGAKVQQGEIRDAVDSTGTVSAVITVQVGSQVSGTIAKLNADFNSRVHKGDVIALIDPQLFRGSVLQASADLQNARANVVAAQANVTKARAAVVQTKADYDRAVALTQMSIGTAQALDQARAAYDTAQAALAAAAANVEQARAQAAQKEAAVAVARTNLDYTVIRSPIDGIVVARNVDVGQTVAASLQAPTLYTIAQDLTQMQVYAKVDESDVGRIRLGQAVTFKVDAFPKELFHGAVSQVRMNPTTVQNVVTYDAIIDFANPRLQLFPGMTAYVTIPVATVAGAVKLPNAALRFKPPMEPEVVRALYAKYGIEEGKPAQEGESGGAGGLTGGGDPRRRTAAETAVVWKLAGSGEIEPVQVALGITDHSFTEVVRLLTGTLRPGDEVVTSALAPKGASAGGGGGPGGPGIRR